MFFEICFAKPTLAQSDANGICHQDNEKGSLLPRAIRKKHIAGAKIATSSFKGLVEVLVGSGFTQISPRSSHNDCFWNL